MMVHETNGMGGRNGVFGVVVFFFEVSRGDWENEGVMDGVMGIWETHIIHLI